MTKDYISLDVETTGLDPVKDRLLEIGAVKVTGGAVRETYSTLIDTKFPVPLRIQELTGITDEMRRTGKEAADAMREFLAFCGGLPVVGHNIPFDFGFLKQTAYEAGLSFEAEGLDTLKIARKLLPEMPSRTLAALSSHYKIDPGNAHRALSDAKAAHELLNCLWKEFGEQDPEAFRLQTLIYKAKKQSPITNSQKGYLKDLIKYHKIEMNIQTDELTKREASRLIDQIILQYGRIMRPDRKEGYNGFLQ